MHHLHGKNIKKYYFHKTLQWHTQSLPMNIQEINFTELIKFKTEHYHLKCYFERKYIKILIVNIINK